MNESQTFPILMTGAQGFVGAALKKKLESRGFKPQALSLELENPNSISKAIKDSLEMLSESLPTHQKKEVTVIHLAGMSFVPDCEKDPKKTQLINVEGTKHILNELKKFDHLSFRFIFSSTSQVYAPTESLITEMSSTAPSNVYSKSKLEAEKAIQTWKDSGHSGLILRFFNHTHHTQPPHFFVPHVYQSLLKKPKTIPVGNLDLYRDIGSLQDLIEALTQVVLRVFPEKRECHVYNICSGHPKNLRKIAETLSQKLNLKVDFVVDPSRVREGEQKVMNGSPQKLMNLIQWKPTATNEVKLVEAFMEDL